nr:transporter [Paraburkholderia dilworthii]
MTIPYLWTETTARFGVGRMTTSSSDRTSNLFDLYFTPIIAGYHLSNTAHIALSFNFWAPTGHYKPAPLPMRA